MTDIFGPSLTSGGTTVRPGETRAFQSTDTFFKDCTNPDADDGTEFAAAWFNQVLAVVRALSRGNGNTGTAAAIIPDDNANDSILLQSVQQLIQRGLTNYAPDTGTADALVVALTPSLAEFKAGAAPIRVKKSNAANTITAPTIVVNGVGPATIVSIDGTALEAGELPANGYLSLLPDSSGNWRLVSARIPATVAEAEAGALLHRFISPQTLLKRRVPYFVLSQLGTSSLPSGVNTIIPLATDSGHYFADAASSIASSNRFTCGAADAGLWLFIGTFGMSDAVAGVQINCAIAKNGGSPSPYQSILTNSDVNTHMTYAIRMTAGDYAQLSGFQNSGSSQTQSQGQLIGYRLSA